MMRLKRNGPLIIQQRCLYTAIFEKTKTVPGFDFFQRHSAEYTKSYEFFFDECEKTFELMEWSLVCFKDNLVTSSTLNVSLYL